MICSCSGSQQAAEGDNGTTIQVWAKWVNAHGGINGYPVRVIVKDDGQNPATSLDYAKELVTRDHIIAMVGETSLVDAAWGNYIASTGVPVVGGVPQEAPFLTNPDFFPSGSQLSLVGGVSALTSSADKHHLGVFYCAEAPICAQAVPPAKAVARLLGMSLTAGAISASEPSYTAQCLAAKSAGVDAIWVADTAPVVQRFAANCGQQGYDPQEVGRRYAHDEPDRLCPGGFRAGAAPRQRAAARQRMASWIDARPVRGSRNDRAGHSRSVRRRPRMGNQPMA